MHILNSLRRTIFWRMDALKGSPIKNHLNEIAGIVENPESPESQEKRNQNLTHLLEHAVGTTNFYKEYKGLKSLQDFPVINKNVILDNYERFKSDVFINSKLTKVSSSGSTGIPFKIYQNGNKRLRNTADVLYFSESAETVLGDRLYFFKLWDFKNRKNIWLSKMQNIHAHSVMDTDSESLKKLVSVIEKDNQPKNILGYPSFFEELCQFLDGRTNKPNFKNVGSIISFAEKLKDSEKSRMVNYFGAPVFERYSNQENGILAQQTLIFPEQYVLNWGSYHFEFLQLDNDLPVNNGELGRLVVTDLFNYAMPMIRYDTGDLAVHEVNEEGTVYLTSIEGRRIDQIFDTQGNPISSHFLYLILEFGAIRQFQFVQKGEKEYLVKLNAKKQQVNEEKISSYCKSRLGTDAQITFEYVDEIPLLASGKRKKIVNEHKKS